MTKDDKEVIFLRVEPEVKERLRALAKAERRDMTSFIMLLIDKRLARASQ